MSGSPNLQQILGRHLAAYSLRHPLDGRRAQVCTHISQCHTEALGGLQMHCDRCHYEVPHYYACRDRHCPMCQQQASQAWAEAQQQALLPVTYYHLIFTLPHQLNGWIQLHLEVIYRRLFQSVWATLKAFAEDPKRLGGQLGMTAVLHTWGQNLSQHVHLHCLVPGGVLINGQRWRPAKSNYLFPVRALSRHFRGGMVSRLRQCAEAGELSRVTDEGEPKRTLDQLMEREWVIYSRPCINNSEQVVNYLARYSHRTAISNNRLLSMTNNQISFRYKDYQDHDQQKTMSLSCEEFIRRYLMHVLPKGLMRIRHYGFLANSCRKKRLPPLRKAIAESSEEIQIIRQPPKAECPHNETPCPTCKVGHLWVVAEIPRKRLEGG
ncbi:MAG: IS91 family transposase [Candidatus Polarisedimenticolaceae bacterium]|nr:IS91 family transposase [Candidatus Polarisedimenticolaceae bacterium]